MKQNKDHIAVYGTLRRGQAAGHMMDKAAFTYVCKDKVKGQLFKIGWYPGLRQGDGEVVVDVFKINDPNGLNAINRYEGYTPTNPKASLFNPITLTTIESKLEVMCYEYNRNIESPEKARIESGDWAIPVP